MKKSLGDKINDIIHNKSLMRKIGFTIFMLALYRLLVYVPVPIADIGALMNATNVNDSGLGYFLILLGGSIQQFSIIAIGLAPYINASIIMQLLTALVPKFQELSEQGESGQQKIQQYTRYLTVPLAFLQGVGMVYFINYLLGAQVVMPILTNLLITGFVMTVGGVMLMWIGELITEKGISNGISLLIFASIVSGITQSVYSSFSTTSNIIGMLLFMLVIVVGLIILSIFILRSIKEIPIIYARKGTVRESSMLPLPMNPVGMIPIIFAIAFVSFPYMLSRMLAQVQQGSEKIIALSNRIEANFNIYSQNPSRIIIAVYFALIVIFTFFYALIQFSPDKMADNIQKRGGFVPGIRPGKETARYINKILMHLCLRGGIGLALIGIYSYVLADIPFISAAVQSLGGLPMVVTGSGVIIMVGVVQEVLNKVQTEMVMQKYEKIDMEGINKNISEL